MNSLASALLVFLIHLPASTADDEPIVVGSELQLMIDEHLIDSMEGVRLQLARPRDEGAVLQFDRSWEGPFCTYSTIIHDEDRFLLYYRGLPTAGADGTDRETTCVAVSTDGLNWARPLLGLFEVDGSRDNNVVLADAAPVTHNFSPFLDVRPGVSGKHRFKALGGNEHSGLIAWSSPDGLRWTRMQEEPVFTEGMFDSQNVAFWSELEQCYCCYFRTWSEGGYSGYRTVSRTTSTDFINWTPPVAMTFGGAPMEHLYTNQTHPYFRSPEIYIAIAARFMPGRQVVSDADAATLGVNPKYFKDCSDAVLLTSRGGGRYDRTFRSAFIRPGVGLENWVSRSNYPALNLVRTGRAEMSVYVNQNYAQPTAELRRYSLRLDGLASVVAGAETGSWITKPMVFSGDHLELNFATSARGGIRIGIQDADGTPVPGFTMDESIEQIGNEIDRTVRWKDGSDLGRLAGRPIRLRFQLTDAEVFAFRFADRAEASPESMNEAALDPDRLELKSVERIWNDGPHSAFTDIIAVDGNLFCTFREGDGHVFGADGRIRVIARAIDGEDDWRSVALLEEAGVDLRDPKLSEAPDGRIMVSFGGSVYDGRTLIGRRSRVAFLDRAGAPLGPIRKVVIDGAVASNDDWLWRVTWYQGVGYGVVYQLDEDEWKVHLVATRNGVDYDHRATLEVPGDPNEVTLRFEGDGTMRAIIRREAGDRRAWRGIAAPPYENWSFEPLGEPLGGPDFMALGDGVWLVGGRRYAPDGQSTVLASIDADGVWSDLAELPSGGDTSYPGFVRIGDTILVSYYSSHEGRTSIYLATLGPK
ncbi:MAG: hypothetical protein P8J59_09035 [Phycisphaerales bacterium]|jgi:hypothetical protein|nr:hypothetical protein [Phycisphaerales bacterium]